jgi:hypothetical protein
MTNQERSQQIADSVHLMEKRAKKLNEAIAAHHALLLCHVTECGPDLGVDPVPLSAGGSK